MSLVRVISILQYTMHAHKKVAGYNTYVERILTILHIAPVSSSTDFEMLGRRGIEDVLVCKKKSLKDMDSVIHAETMKTKSFTQSSCIYINILLANQIVGNGRGQGRGL